MLWVYVPRDTSLERVPIVSKEEVPDSSVWFDLVNPNTQEDKIVEYKVGIAVPTREEMQEIEVTSRLYVENGARYMTATLMCQADTPNPKTTPITFILSGHRLITVRYEEPRPFMIVGHKLGRVCSPAVSGESVLMELLDAVIDRTADILERIGGEVDQISHDIFEPEGERADRSYNQILRAIGRKGDLTSKVRESLVSIELMLRFASPPARGSSEESEPQGHIGTMLHDISSLDTQTEYLLGKVQFLLDSILGFVNLNQNDIIKILSVIMVVFTPPTFFASMYGMNFKNMPEYDWAYGYQYGLVLMLVSAVVPYLVFRWKKWL